MRIDFTQTIEFLSLLVLTGAIANVGSRRVRTGVRLYALQSLALAATAACVAYTLEEPHLYLAAALAAVVKGFAIPQIIFYILKKIEVKREVESFLGIPSSLLVAALLVGLAFHASNTALGLGITEFGALPSTLLAVSLAVMLIGFFLMINRKKAITQVIGLSVMENGLFLAAIALTSGMPLVIEMGIFFELMIGVMLMGILILKIKTSFDTINVHEMHTLTDFTP